MNHTLFIILFEIAFFAWIVWSMRVSSAFALQSGELHTIVRVSKVLADWLTKHKGKVGKWPEDAQDALLELVHGLNKLEERPLPRDVQAVDRVLYAIYKRVKGKKKPHA